MIGVIIILSLLLLDQISKIIAKINNKSEKNYFKGFFNLTYIENSGGATGILNGRYYILDIVTLWFLLNTIFLYRNVNFETNLLYSLGLASVIAGVLGNFTDRIIRGYVIDFIYFKKIIFKKRSTYVYNLADFMIMIGFVLLIISIFV